MTGDELIADAINRMSTYLSTPSTIDAHLEPTNVVDGLMHIGSGLHRIADVLDAAGFRDQMNDIG